MNISTQAAQAIIDQLQASGVGDLVLAPGSRSAPLALAAAQAVGAGRLRLHVRIDERSAAYLALGLAKVSRRPVAVACTSGTAVANLLPAVVEASYSGIPLVVLTADRPPNLRHVGANQTIDQAEIFGANVRYFADLTAHLTRHRAPSASVAGGSLVDAEDQSVELARHEVSRALAAALAGHASGPVHLNIGFAEPLVPDVSSGVDPDDTVTWRLPALRAQKVSTQGGPQAIGEVLQALRGSAELSGCSAPARGVVVVGDVPTPDWSARAVALAQACGWPVISEPSGNATASPNTIAHFALLLGSQEFARAHEPDLVITVGRFGISRPTLALVKSARHHVAVATPGRDRPDPLHSAATILDAVPDPPASPMAASADSNWLACWQDAATLAEAVLLSHGTPREPTHFEPLDGPGLARLVVAACGPDDLLLLAASRSVRDVQDYAAPTRTAPWIIGNRGAAGIDGLVSTVWGAALAHGGRTIALLGDLAFLHDCNGLLAPQPEPRPDLTIIVADNNGGGIFSSLEQGAPRFAGQFEELFGTPHDLDLVAVARAHGAQAVAVTTGDELQQQLARPPGVGMIKVIVVQLPDRASEAAIRLSLASQVSAALA